MPTPPRNTRRRRPKIKVGTDVAFPPGALHGADAFSRFTVTRIHKKSRTIDVTIVGGTPAVTFLHVNPELATVLQ